MEYTQEQIDAAAVAGIPVAEYVAQNAAPEAEVSAEETPVEATDATDETTEATS